MLPRNVDELLSRLKPTDLVLDVGGWACPFNRAQWILDAEPYATRGYYKTFGGPPSQGGDQEWFTKDTWVQKDICDHLPWPFEDKQFDFVICSHTLEDVRDPLWVCSELIRVGKRGYIEVPSREWETCRGIERPNLVGMSHHRWLVEIANSHIHFLQKYHTIHSHWRFSFPNSYDSKLPEDRKVQWLWWNDAFSFNETTIHGVDNQEAALERYVQERYSYPRWRLGIDLRLRKLGPLHKHVRNTYAWSILRKCKRVLLSLVGR